MVTIWEHKVFFFKVYVQYSTNHHKAIKVHGGEWVVFQQEVLERIWGSMNVGLSAEWGISFISIYHNHTEVFLFGAYWIFFLY